MVRIVCCQSSVHSPFPSASHFHAMERHSVALVPISTNIYQQWIPSATLVDQQGEAIPAESWHDHCQQPSDELVVTFPWTVPPFISFVFICMDCTNDVFAIENREDFQHYVCSPEANSTLDHISAGPSMLFGQGRRMWIPSSHRRWAFTGQNRLASIDRSRINMREIKTKRSFNTASVQNGSVSRSGWTPSQWHISAGPFREEITGP